MSSEELSNIKVGRSAFSYFVICYLLFVILTAAGCGKNPDPVDSADPPFNSYRDIPGVTPDEIAAVELIKNEFGSLVYGMPTGIEAFKNGDGVIQGFSVFLCEWLTSLFGIPFVPSLHNWSDLLKMLEDGTVDFTGEMRATPERRKIYFMTDTIAERVMKRYHLADIRPFGEISMTRPLRYGLIEGSAGTVLNYLEPGTYEMSYVANIDDVPGMLRSGRLDAFFHSNSAEANFIEHGDIIAADFLPVINSPVSLTTRNPKLEPVISVVQRVLQSDGVRQYLAELYKTGYAEYKKHEFFTRLTVEEREYIKNNPVVKYAAENNRYPVSFYEIHTGQWQGIANDTLKEVEALTGLSFKIVNDSKSTWPQMLAMLNSGEASMISELIPFPERVGQYFFPVNSVMHDHYALLSKADYPNIRVNEVINAKVGLLRGTLYITMFNNWFPLHEFNVEYDSFDEAIAALDRDEIDLIMACETRVLYLTNYYERPEFKANIVFDISFPSVFGFNKNEKVLCSIIDKALGQINTTGIARHWMSKTYDYKAKVAQAQLPWLIGAVILSFVVLSLILILFYRDRAERKRLANLLVEVNAASRAKSSFLSTMSHEMRTPMNAIIGMTAIGKNAEDIERKDYALYKIEDAATHLLGVISDVLDISKIEANKLELSPIEFNIEKMLQRIVSIINFRMDEKHQRFTLNVDKDIPRFIIGDDHRLSQVIINLLSNAVKFSPENSEIDLGLTLAGEKDGICEIRITVSDNGIGISPEQQSKLFGVFQQADSGINREFGGTGLGLSISKHIVELMGGEIRIESEPGKGSRFIFTVKAERGKKNSASVPAPGVEGLDNGDEGRETDAYGRFAGKKLLVAEDVEINREILLSLLEDTGISVDCAENGIEAVEMVSVAPDKYDAVLMDVQMPKMDGLEATRLIRELTVQRFENLPIIAMTAHVFKSDIEECLKAGMDDHIGKPIDIDVVMKKLNKYLSRPR